jgi:hypothetical protein
MSEKCDRYWRIESPRSTVQAWGSCWETLSIALTGCVSRKWEFTISWHDTLEEASKG